MSKQIIITDKFNDSNSNEDITLRCISDNEYNCLAHGKSLTRCKECNNKEKLTEVLKNILKMLEG